MERVARNCAPVERWRQRTRAGVTMSQRMLLILRDMRAAQEAGHAWVYADGVHPRTLRKMIESGWVAVSPGKGIDRDRVRITSLGLRMLRRFEQPPRRFDGICPRCGERAKQVHANGYVEGYCAPCAAEHKRRNYELKGHRVDPAKPCSRCKERPRHILSSGKAIAYCAECRRSFRSEERQRQKARKLERLARGEIILCSRCGQRCVCHTERSVQDYCWPCLKALRVERHQRKTS